MQQFVVPQFIDVEDKIFGPITTRQFLILLVAGIFSFLAYRFADFALFITTIVICGGLAIIFAFVKVNGQPFHYFILNIIQTYRKPSLRIWNKKYDTKELEYTRKSHIDTSNTSHHKVRPVKRDRIHELSLLVNTGGFYNPDER